MKEELLHYVWKLKCFDFHKLLTQDGEKISIKEFGTHNSNAGPDFLNSKIFVGNTLWVGHVEIHLKSSDWYHHKHHLDAAYDNVILHVVYNDDKEVFNSKGWRIPCLELSDRISKDIINNFEKLNASLDWIPCAGSIKKIEKERIDLFLQRVLVNRLQRKSKEIEKILDKNTNDFEATLYQILLKHLGMKVNGKAFERLSEVLPYRIIKKYSDNVHTLEALILGQAGLLMGMDSYTTTLKREHSFLTKKHKLYSMTGLEWKFLRLRPANFPTLRLAQLAMLFHHSPQLFSKIINGLNVFILDELFKVRASTYWDTHYIPNRESKYAIKTIGKTARNNLIINVAVPLSFTYGKTVDDEEIKEKAVDILYNLTPESNKIVRKWKEFDVRASNAAKSQALIELKHNYCDQYQCLKCSIGQQVLFHETKHSS